MCFHDLKVKKNKRVRKSLINPKAYHQAFSKKSGIVSKIAQ